MGRSRPDKRIFGRRLIHLQDEGLNLESCSGLIQRVSVKKFISVIFLLLFFVQASAFAADVYIVKNSDRIKALEQLFTKYQLPALAGKKVVIKPNFNSDDPFPATTSLETLQFIIKKVKEAGAKSITIAERSGMGDTRKNLERLGVIKMAEHNGVKVIVLDELGEDEWVKIPKGNTHWLTGFPVAKVYLDADYVINLPCLKTHRFGGQFTMSLKNNVGAVAKWYKLHNYMWELHMSRSKRLMIAEINKYVPAHLIIMDAMKGFVTKGPETGELIQPDLVLLSTDRVAIDAVGVAILRSYGTTEEVAAGKIFDQEQIKRAAELGVGVRSPKDINIISVNDRTAEVAKVIISELNK